MSRRVFAFLLVVIGAVAVGCSGEVSFSVGGKSPEAAAEERIERQDFVDRVGQGPLTAECNDPGDVEPGDTFLCTATTEQGGLVRILTTVVDDETINVQAQNLVTAEGRVRLENAIVQSLNQQNGLNLTPQQISCGEGAVLLDAEMKTTCALANPADGKVYDAHVTVTDLASGAFSVDVAQTPRG